MKLVYMSVPQTRDDLSSPGVQKDFFSPADMLVHSKIRRIHVCIQLSRIHIILRASPMGPQQIFSNDRFTSFAQIWHHLKKLALQRRWQILANGRQA